MMGTQFNFKNHVNNLVIDATKNVVYCTNPSEVGILLTSLVSLLQLPDSSTREHPT